MNIEQIALEIFQELEQPYGDLDTPAIGKENITYFLRRCLAKIGEGVEPVAWIRPKDIGSETAVVSDTQSFSDWKPLYATPAEAILAAAQLRRIENEIGH